ncbi:rCG21410 [Rattus norvegicus]|uniref:RCG21410 n=1 Tax=Rattus norvegicus TaxID=10116 RepID=A6J1G8_RAT|nr:rCG21410 [Rattus norvegicus]
MCSSAARPCPGENSSVHQAPVRGIQPVIRLQASDPVLPCPGTAFLTACFTRLIPHSVLWESDSEGKGQT